MPEHNVLTGAQLHEPKGVASAAAGTSYKADGLGSGSWQDYRGFGQYQDTQQAVGTPTQTIATGVRTQFICDGGFLIEERLPTDAVAPLWDVASNLHRPIKAFDTYDVRFNFKAQNYTGSSPYLTMEIDIGGSIGVIVSQTIPLIKGGAEQAIVFSCPVFTGATYFANGGAFYLTYVGTAPCDIFGNSVVLVRNSRDG